MSPMSLPRHAAPAGGRKLCRRHFTSAPSAKYGDAARGWWLVAVSSQSAPWRGASLRPQGAMGLMSVGGLLDSCAEHAEAATEMIQELLGGGGSLRTRRLTRLVVAVVFAINLGVFVSNLHRLYNNQQHLPSSPLRPSLHGAIPSPSSNGRHVDVQTASAMVMSLPSVVDVVHRELEYHLMLPVRTTGVQWCNHSIQTPSLLTGVGLRTHRARRHRVPQDVRCARDVWQTSPPVRVASVQGVCARRLRSPHPRCTLLPSMHTLLHAPCVLSASAARGHMSCVWPCVETLTVSRRKVQAGM